MAAPGQIQLDDRQHDNPRPAPSRTRHSTPHAETGTVTPHSTRNPRPTWGGWLAGLRSAPADPTPSKSKRVGSATTPLQPTSHPKSKTKSKSKPRSKSKTKVKIKVKTKSKPGDDYYASKTRGPDQAMAQARQKAPAKPGPGKDGRKQPGPGPYCLEASKAPSTAPAPLRHQIRETQPETGGPHDPRSSVRASRAYTYRVTHVDGRTITIRDSV
jgi:hypothetical protein